MPLQVLLKWAKDKKKPALLNAASRGGRVRGLETRRSAPLTPGDRSPPAQLATQSRAPPEAKRPLLHRPRWTAPSPRRRSPTSRTPGPRSSSAASPRRSRRPAARRPRERAWRPPPPRTPRRRARRPRSSSRPTPRRSRRSACSGGSTAPTTTWRAPHRSSFHLISPRSVGLTFAAARARG